MEEPERLEEHDKFCYECASGSILQCPVHLQLLHDNHTKIEVEPLMETKASMDNGEVEFQVKEVRLLI